ncbi:MAG: tyrosine/phenylalanine carboxypeptidase domain-containing protein [Candidatus Microsaccharimonas sp.]
MNEHLQAQYSTEVEKTAERITDPRELPEAGFQSYEKLKNNSVAEKPVFLSGEIRNPRLEYSGLKNLADMDQGILNLYDAIETIKTIEPDEGKVEAYSSSLSFRMAEMEYIKLLARLNFVVSEDGDESTVRELIDQVRQLGAELYGEPEQGLRDSTFATIRKVIEGKQLSASAQALYDDLNNGFSWGDVAVDALPSPENTKELPSFEHPSLNWAGEIILEKNAVFAKIVEEYFDAKVAEHGEGYSASPEDVLELIKIILVTLDPDNESGIDAVLDPEATSLSWSSPELLVKVGANRAVIKTANKLFVKSLHEVIIHAGRAVNGFKSELSVLGTGLFTNTERQDYLTFEEGFGVTTEEIVGDVKPEWKGLKLSHYTSIALAERGDDFRSVFETSWRYRLLMDLKDGEEVTEEMITKKQALIYPSIVRVFRGMPQDLKAKYPDMPSLTFNKDLAYLNGRVLAMNHIAELYETKDTEGLLDLFLAKYDPTVPEQKALFEKYKKYQQIDI